MTFVLISDGVDQQFACVQLAKQLRELGQSCLTVGRAKPTRSDVVSHLPVLETDLELSARELLGTPLLDEADAIGLFLKDTLQEQSFAKNYRAICRSRQAKPALLFGGAVGIDVGDRLISALSERNHLDLVMVPGERHAAEAEAMTRHWPEHLNRPAILSAGLWFLPERPPIGSLSGAAGGSGRPMPKTLVALVQKTIPTQVGGKTQLLRQLLSWADSSPDWNVIVTRDHTATGQQPWIRKFNPGDWSFPANAAFASPEQMLPLLSNCSACITVSSPWALAPICWGRQCLVIGDFGIHTDQGTTAFFGSGLMHRLSAVSHLDDLMKLPTVNRHWLEAIGWARHDGPDRLIRTLAEIEERRR